MDIKEIRKQLEAQKAQEQTQAQEAYDTGDSVDTIQGTVERLVAAIDKSIVIKDVTQYTTQATLFPELEVGKFYLVNWLTNKAIVYVPYKSATNAYVTGFSATLGVFDSLYGLCNSTSTNALALSYARTNIATPTADGHAATKHYVDTADTTTLTAAKAYTDANSGGLTIKTAIEQHNQTHLPADCKFDNIISCSAQFSPASNGIIYGTFAGAKESNNWFIGFEAGSNNEFFTIKDDGSYQKSGSPSRVTVTYWV